MLVYVLFLTLGYVGVDQAQCESKGCCWNPGNEVHVVLGQSLSLLSSILTILLTHGCAIVTTQCSYVVTKYKS